MVRCSKRCLVDRHFEGRILPAEERGLRKHLADCANCTKYYERRLLLARLEPEALKPKQRLARGLGFRRRAG